MCDEMPVAARSSAEVGAELVYNIKPNAMVILGQPEMWILPFAGITLYY